MNNNKSYETKNNEKIKHTYSRIENIIAEILWSAFFYLTIFNMSYNAGKSVLFLHMRVITDNMSIVYIAIALMIILLNNIVFKADRSLPVDISVGLIPTAITLSIYYFKINLFAKATIVLLLIFLAIGVYHVVKKDVKNSYTWTYISLGILSLIVCIFFIYSSSKLDYAYLYKPLDEDVYKEIGDVFAGFEYFAKGYKDDLMEADEEHLKELCDAKDIKGMQELLQKLVDYEMLYLGVEDEVVVRIDKSLIGDEKSVLEGNVIYISEDFITGPHKDRYYSIYDETFFQGARYYYIILADHESNKGEESNLLFYKKLRAWKYYYDNTPTGIDTELIQEGYDDYSYGVLGDISSINSDVTYGLYHLVNGKDPWDE
ncbi:MAG: hypothetical protein IJV15_06360 [Lachnospiraceae bacterium]|nr:hypothetical protein [Lachnospiraceae bacterium]